MGHIFCYKTYPEILVIVAYSNDVLKEGSLYFLQKIYEIWLTSVFICDRPGHMYINVSLNTTLFYRETVFEEHG